MDGTMDLNFLNAAKDVEYSCHLHIFSPTVVSNQLFHKFLLKMSLQLNYLHIFQTHQQPHYALIHLMTGKIQTSEELNVQQFRVLNSQFKTFWLFQGGIAEFKDIKIHAIWMQLYLLCFHLLGKYWIKCTTLFYTGCNDKIYISMS